jgi:hypothetical protein
MVGVIGTNDGDLTARRGNFAEIGTSSMQVVGAYIAA